MSNNEIDIALGCADSNFTKESATGVLAAEVRRLRDEVNGLTGKLERAETVLQNLMSFLSVNGCRTEIDPENAELRIRDGINMLVRPALERAELAEKALKEAQEQEPVAFVGSIDPSQPTFPKLWTVGEFPPIGTQLYARPVPAVPDANPVQWLEDEGDMILVPRGLLGASCSAINKQSPAPKVLEALRHYTMNAPRVPAVPEEWREVVNAMVEWWDDQHMTMAQGREIRNKARALLQSADKPVVPLSGQEFDDLAYRILSLALNNGTREAFPGKLQKLLMEGTRAKQS